MTIALRYAARSDVGLLREGNEDSAYASGRLLAVADGMGGHAHGEVASSVAIAAMSSLDEDTQRAVTCSAPSRRPYATPIASCTRWWTGTRASRAWAPRSPRCSGTAPRVALVHVGDSRAYLLRTRGALPDHPRPHARAVAGRRRPDHPGGGRHPPAALDPAAGARRQRRGRPRPARCARPRSATATCSAPTACPGW